MSLANNEKGEEIPLTRNKLNKLSLDSQKDKVVTDKPIFFLFNKIFTGHYKK